jgi:hypothetical protein
MEIWKDIKDYEGIYQASNFGNLRSLNYKRSGKIQVLKPALDNKGYLRTALMKSGVLKTVKVHRVIAQTFIENLNNKPQVNHINGVKNDNTIVNLEWCDNTENQNHAIKLGLTKKRIRPLNELNKKIKISDEALLSIFEEFKNGASKRSLAKKYNVDRGIFRRNILKDVK